MTDWMRKIASTGSGARQHAGFPSPGAAGARRRALPSSLSKTLDTAAQQAPQFLKAEEDVRAGRDTLEKNFYFWSKSKDAPQPAASNSYFLVRPKQPGYDAAKNEFWQWSDRAQQYYWTRWPGKDAEGKRCGFRNTTGPAMRGPQKRKKL